MKKPNTSDSLIIRLVAFLTKLFYAVLPFGLLGRLFTSYSATDRAFRRSAVGHAIEYTEHGGGRLRRLFRRNVALAVNHSLLVRASIAFRRRLCGWSLRTFGALLITTGSYIGLMYWLFSSIWQSSVVGSENLYWAIGFVVIGILLLFSDLSVGYALSQSLFLRKLNSSASGISDGILGSTKREGEHSYVIAIPLGMVLGAIGALISPFWLLVGFAALLLALLILSIPEVGVILLIATIPFMGIFPKWELWLVLLIVVTCVAYVGKLLCGNRAFHLEVTDMPILLMAVLFLLSGFSFAGGSAWHGALLSTLLVSIYFLVVNLLATPIWTNRCRVTLILAAAGASLLGIVQFVQSAFGNFDYLQNGAAVCAGFADRISFSYFLVIAFCFTLAAFVAEQNRYRFVTGLALMLILTALTLAFVPWALLSLAVVLIAFCLLYYRHSLPFVLLGCGGVRFVWLFVPQSGRRALLDVLRYDVVGAGAHRATANSLASRIFFENGDGIFNRNAGFMRFLTGLGYGGIERFCALYTSAPAEFIGASLDFWTYRLLENGVFGVILPAAFFFLLAQGCFSLLRKGDKGQVGYFALAGITLLAGLLVFSAFSYTWGDPASLAIFFAATAMIAADARTERENHVVLTDDVEQVGKVAELEYYGTR